MAATTGATISFVMQAPKEIILAGAGLALLGTMVGSLTSIVEDSSMKVPAVITFLVASSGFAAFSIGSAFWALLMGVAVWLWLSARANRVA
jgi:benzoate membrane transport protein